MKPIRLRDLCNPLSVHDFIRDYWIPEKTFVSQPSPELLKKIAQVPALKDGPSLIQAFTTEISLFGPNKFRAVVPANAAQAFVQQGYTAYMHDLERAIPVLFELCSTLTLELGIPESSVSLEGFYAERGAVSSAHYDHDVNFQVLISGRKLWRIAPNDHIKNPLNPYHPRTRLDGTLGGFSEEAYATHPDVPVDMPTEGVTEYTTEAGSVVFLPRAHWHEVHMLEGSFAINFVIKGLTWASAIALALSRRMLSAPEARAYVTGNLAQSALLNKQGQANFKAMIARAHQDLDRLTMDEVFLANSNNYYEWAPKAKDRRLEKAGDDGYLHIPGAVPEPIHINPDAVLVVEALASFRHRFSFSDALTKLMPRLTSELTALALWNMLTVLTKEGLIVRNPA